ADQRAVVESVIRALELDNLVTARGCPRESDGVHRRFRTAGSEAHHLDREAGANFFREFPFHVMRHAEHGSGGQPSRDGLHDRGMAMTRHQRTEAQVVIDVLVTVKIAELAPAAFLYEDRVWIVGAVVARNTERQASQVLLMRLRRLGRALFKRN